MSQILVTFELHKQYMEATEAIEATEDIEAIEATSNFLETQSLKNFKATIYDSLATFELDSPLTASEAVEAAGRLRGLGPNLLIGKGSIWST